MMNQKQRDFALHYGYQTDENEFSVPPSLEFLEKEEDVSSYMNHSCDPTVDVLDADVWVLRRNVRAGEEITYDYAMSEVAFDRLPTCACGTSVCRKRVTRNDYLLPELRERYKMSWSLHVLRRLEQLEKFIE
jgi:hypothetical protein